MDLHSCPMVAVAMHSQLTCVRSDLAFHGDRHSCGAFAVAFRPQLPCSRRDLTLKWAFTGTLRSQWPFAHSYPAPEVVVPSSEPSSLSYDRSDLAFAVIQRPHGPCLRLDLRMFFVFAVALHSQLTCARGGSVFKGTFTVALFSHWPFTRS
jgi:hypothetical protein